MNPLLVDDLFTSICNDLPSMKEIIELELLSKYHHNVIRNNTWNKEIIIQDNYHINHIFNYKFRNIDIHRIHRTYFLNSLSKYKELGNDITLDASIKALEKLQYFKLIDNGYTDENIQFLRSLNTVDIRNCDNITNVSCLKNVKRLFLINCPNITDESIRELVNVKQLYIHSCPNVTIKTINYLKSKGCQIN